MSWLLATGTERRSIPAEWLETLAWLVPGGVAFLIPARLGSPEPIRLVSAGLLIVAGVFVLRWLRSTHIRSGLGIAVLVAAAVGVLWMQYPAAQWDASDQLPIGLLFLLPVPYLVRDFAKSAGLATVRKARAACRRLLTRTEWPIQPTDCRHLPEVRALRDAILLDPTPALNLLNDPRMSVKVSALMAMENRVTWLPGQADQIAYLLTTSEEPLLRAGCLRALAPITDPALTSVLLSFLRDPSKEVRKATIESILYRPEKRWHQIRVPLHDFLNDPRYANDGALTWTGSLLPTSAVNDLMSWAAETGTVAMRATLTLVAYYHRALGESGSPELVTQLIAQMRNTRLPAVFRVELAHLLKQYGCLEATTLEQMLNSSEPSPLRLLAAEALLTESGGDHESAVAALREIARHPNREMALTVAGIVQKCLRLDMGLPWGQAVPSTQSKQAAEVTRRVMAWANHDAFTPPAGTSIGSIPDLPPPPQPKPVEPPPPSSDPTGWDW